MPNSASEKLTLLKEIMTNGTIKDALQLIKDIEQLENLTPEETLRTLGHKAYIWSLEKPLIALKFAEELYQRSQEINKPLYSLDALNFKAVFYYRLGKLKEYFKILEQGENLFNSIPREDSSDFQEREADLFFGKSLGQFLQGNLGTNDNCVCSCPLETF